MTTYVITVTTRDGSTTSTTKSALVALARKKSAEAKGLKAVVETQHSTKCAIEYPQGTKPGLAIVISRDDSHRDVLAEIATPAFHLNREAESVSAALDILNAHKASSVSIPNLSENLSEACRTLSEKIHDAQANGLPYRAFIGIKVEDENENPLRVVDSESEALASFIAVSQRDGDDIKITVYKNRHDHPDADAVPQD